MKSRLIELEIQDRAPAYICESPLTPAKKHALWRASGREILMVGPWSDATWTILPAGCAQSPVSYQSLQGTRGNTLPGEALVP